MSSPTAAETLDAALERAITRLGDASATSEQIRQHFAFGERPCGERACGELVVAVAQEEGGTAALVLDAASAVTIVAAAARVHADLATEVAERAGRPTVWARFGIAHGINAGDALGAVACLALADDPAGPPERTLAMMRALHDAYLAASDGRARAIARDRLDLLGALPTALRAVACRLGALAAAAPPERAGAYAALGAAPSEASRDALAERAGIDRSGRVRALVRETARLEA
jgi:geranylgeranyl pyrophosphate synthase